MDELWYDCGCLGVTAAGPSWRNPLNADPLCGRDYA
jgi:hypothetical protein